MLRSFIARITGADRRRVDRRTLVLLESITRHLRGGASLRTAVMTASTDSPDLFDLVLGASLVDGAPLAEALDEWMNDAVPSKILVGTALRLATDAGGAVATVLDGVAESLRDRLHLDREVAALASQARASAVVLLVAPIGFAILMAGADPRVAGFQFGSPIGWLCCALGLMLDGVGAFWMSRMIARVR
jgi:tight adherence protein B